MSKKDLEGFLSDNPFFVALKIQEENHGSLNRFFDKVKDVNGIDEGFEWVYEELLRNFLRTHKDIDGYDYKKYIPFVQETILEYIIEEDALKFFFNPEEENKIIDLVNRGQFNAKMLKIAYSKIANLFSNIHCEITTTDIPAIIERDLKRKINKFNDDYIMNKMGKLKEVVDKIASGVKNQCYLEFDKSWYNNDSLVPELAEYVKNKHGYDYSHFASHQYLYFDESDAQVLSHALVDDDNIWLKQEYQNKNIFGFLNYVVQYNDLKHAEKIIDCAFNNLCKNEISKFLYEKKLPLVFSKDGLLRAKLNCVAGINSKVGSFVGKEIDESDYNGLVYPLYSGFDEKIANGEDVFERFVKKAYPDDYNKVFEIFDNPNSIIQDASGTKRLITIAYLIEGEYFGYGDDKLKDFVYSYYDNYGSDESILKRMYYIFYLIDKLSGVKSEAYLYEYFFDLFDMIDFKYNLQCFYKRDLKFRNASFISLKKLLSKYDLNISDDYKDLYITALLDRKYASLNEVDKFPELEQFGDAIYQLAVDNILFYNDFELNHVTEEALVKAKYQIEVSKKLGLDKLYISNLSSGANSKYHNIEGYDNGFFENDKDYIADSLEMVIGVIGKEFGVQKALDFATRIIVETDDELSMPHFVESDIVKNYNSDIDKDYLAKIYPSPYDEDSEYYSEYITMWYAIRKILLISIIGNDTKQKRQMISGFSDKVFGSSYENHYQCVVSYLYYGIEETIEKYKSIVNSNYREEN